MNKPNPQNIGAKLIVKGVGPCDLQTNELSKAKQAMKEKNAEKVFEFTDEKGLTVIIRGRDIVTAFQYDQRQQRRGPQRGGSDITPPPGAGGSPTPRH